MCPSKLCFVDPSAWWLYHIGKFINWWYVVQFVWFLDDAKTTIRTKLRMSSNQKWVSNWMMKLKYCPPSQVPYKIIVFVLAWTIIGIKMNRSFSKSMMFEVMVHVIYGDVCSFTDVTGFINQVVYLPRDRLAHHSKNRTLTRRFKVDWPGLHRVAWYMHLLCEVKGVVHCSCQWARFVTPIKVYLVHDGLKTAFRLFANLSIKLSLCLHWIQMLLLCLNAFGLFFFWKVACSK